MNIIYVILELGIMTFLSFILGFASEDGGIILFLSFLVSILLGAIPATIAYRKKLLPLVAVWLAALPHRAHPFPAHQEGL